MEVYSTRITARSLEALRALDAMDLDLKRRAAHRVSQTAFEVPALLTAEQIQQTQAAGYRVEVVEDLTGVPEERLQEVSRTNRFAGGRYLLEFEERAVLGYMTVSEIDSALLQLTTLHSDVASLIVLPHTTWEGRTCRAVRLRAGPAANRVAVLVTGGMHAREWGGSDICVTLAIRLVNAYKANAALGFGGKTYTAAQVRAVLERLDLFIFPAVNPDGKHYSQTTDPSAGSSQSFWWRKNRNPNSSVPGSSRGVDLNRNFDFLWSSGIGTSTSPSSNLYRGTTPFSEPEARNVRHLFDTYPSIRYYVDVHSFGELLLYSWGDDDNQQTDPQQNFRNPAFDGMRGIPGDGAYREFISSLDHNTVTGLAARMNAALTAVRGRAYQVRQAVGLYPTSATSDDYAFSRHIVDPGKNKVYAYTVEFGTEFVPPIAEMNHIIREVGAALTELCLAATADVYLVDNPADTGAVPSGTPFWNSPDIWVRNADDGGTTHQNTIRGRDNFVYVRVRNRGLETARDLKIRAYIASYAGTQFVHPHDWVPRSAAGGVATAGTYLIAEAPVPSLAPGATRTVRMRWPALLIPPALNWHPCLLVEVAPNDGLTTARPHVWESNNLAQKNITIVNARRGEALEFEFRAGSAFNPQPVTELVVNKVTAPANAVVYLDLKALSPLITRPLNELILPLPPVVPGIGPAPADDPAGPLEAVPQGSSPAIPNGPKGWPLIPAGGVSAVLLSSTTLATPLSMEATDPTADSLVVRLPVGTRVQTPGERAEEPEEGERALATGFETVVLGDRPVLSLTTAKQGTLRLPSRLARSVPMSLRIAVPDAAAPGDVYEFQVVQYGAKRRPVGGVTLQVHVTR